MWSLLRAGGMNRSATDVFDSEEFVDDVLDWLEDHEMSRRGLAKTAQLDLSNLLGVLRGERPVSLLSACSLADVCDLSLDDYRRAAEERRS
jgi:hypothetical protein